ncbi:MAG: hypothetical protein JNM22_08450 [Saprospiraceae bacterium]|nr:hypothetical protein [Saprospiraceae bacterium]
MKASLVLLWVFAGNVLLNAQTALYNAGIHTADSLFQIPDYPAAAQAYRTAFEVFAGKAYPEDRFKAARAWAMTGKADSAFFHLERLQSKTDFLDVVSTWEQTPELAALTSDFRWTRLLTQIALKNERNAAIQNNPLGHELEQIYTLDQWYRIHMDSVISLHGRASPEFRDFVRRSTEQDSLNQLRVRQIIEEHGWLGTDVVSKRATKALFLVVQHAELPMQERYVPLLRQAVAEGKADAENLAYLEDRILMRQGKPQRYGSQIVTDKSTGAWILYQVEDPENLDKRRATVGLGPIAAYLEATGAIWEK